MKVLFLDLDGVVNRGSGFFIPELVRELNRILDVTGAKVVIHSSRRYNNTLWELRVLLKKAGFTGDAIDMTPCPKFKIEPGSDIFVVPDDDFAEFIRGLPRKFDSERPASILLWLETHPEVEKYVILDDVQTMAHLDPHFVKTDMTAGLTPALADRAIAMLTC